MKTIKKLLHLITITLSALIILAFLSFFFVTGLNLDTKFLKTKIESIASSKLNRVVVIEGPLDVHYGLSTSITINNLKISNPIGWNTGNKFLNIGGLKVQVGLIPMLRKKIKIKELLLNSLEVRLETNERGNNWDKISNSIDTSNSKSIGSKSIHNLLKNFEINILIITDLTVIYVNSSSYKTHKIEIENLNGSLLGDEPIMLHVNGKYQNVPYKFIVRGGSITEIYDADNKYPLKFSGYFAGTALNIDGTIFEPLNPQEVKLNFSLEGKKTSNIEHFLNFDLPEADEYSLEGKLLFSRSTVQVHDVDLQLGKSKINANITADFSKKIPYIEGKIHASTLDLVPMLEVSIDKKADQLELDIRKALDLLNLINANIDVSINHLTHNWPLNITDISSRIEIRNKELNAPIEFTLEGIIIAGGLKLGLFQDMPIASLNLHSPKPGLSNILQFVGDQEIKAGLESFDLELSGSGEDLTSILTSLEGNLTITDALLYYKTHAKNQVSQTIKIDIVKIELDPNVGIVGSIHGNLLSLPYSISLTTCKTDIFLKGHKCDLKITANNSISRLEILGDLIKTKDFVDTNFKLNLSADNLYDYEQVIDDKFNTDLPFMLSLEFMSSKYEIAASNINLKIGNSNLNGYFSRKWKGSETFEIIDFSSELIDLNELLDIFESFETEKQTTKKTELGFDVTILTKESLLINTDIDIYIAKIAIGRAELTNTIYKSDIRNGLAGNTQFSSEFEDTHFNGKSIIKVVDDIPQINFTLETNDIDIGKLLFHLGIPADPYIKAEQLKLELLLIGRTIGELLEKSIVKISLKYGEWHLADKYNGNEIIIDKLNGALTIHPVRPTTLTLEGLYNTEPIKINLESDNLLMLWTSHALKYSVNMNVEVPGVNFELNGWVAYPFNKKDAKLDFSLNGRSLNSLNDLLDIDLPNSDQYTISGNIITSGDKFFIQDLKFNFEDSIIEGSIEYLYSGENKKLNVDLFSHTIELTDVIKGQDKNNNKSLNHMINRNSTDKIDPENAIYFEPIINALNLQTIDAKLKIYIEKLLIKEQFIGSIEINGELHQGNLSMNHFEISTPGGVIESLFNTRFIKDNIILEIVTRVENFDYSFLAKIIDPDSIDNGGVIDLSLDLKSYGLNIKELNDQVSGYINFRVVPKSVDADLFDLWSTNIFNALSSLSRKSKSNMNCVVGGMKFTNGLINPKKLYIDTTNVRVRVTGNIDLRQNQIDLLFKPIPKRRQIFHLGVPLQVVGTFDNYTVTTDLFNIWWFIVRLYYVAYEFILNIFSEHNIPLDGSDICSITVQDLLLE